jgi:DNA replication and repair protein RecF
MSLDRLELVDFRSFARGVLEPDPAAATVLTGPNGAGKTTVLEAVAYLGLQRSFRGAPREVLVRAGCERAVVRAELRSGEAPVLVEAEVAVAGRSRAQVNRQPARSRAVLAEAVPVTVFSPDDLGIVQGGPARRRDVLDDALRQVDPRSGALVDEVERVLRQRAALLRQAGGRLGREVADTLEVWDERLSSAGTALVTAREVLVAELEPAVAGSYAGLASGGREAPHAGARAGVTLAYRRSWEGDLATALAAARTDDVRRAATTVGPHRDELELGIGGHPARLQASQGEQRCLALAVRLAVHRLVTGRTGAAPILLLDDVFSELDPSRSCALVRELPAGQSLVTTAVPLPAGVTVGATVDVRELGCRPGAGDGGDARDGRDAGTGDGRGGAPGAGAGEGARGPDGGG